MFASHNNSSNPHEFLRFVATPELFGDKSMAVGVTVCTESGSIAAVGAANQSVWVHRLRGGDTERLFREEAERKANRLGGKRRSVGSA